MRKTLIRIAEKINHYTYLYTGMIFISGDPSLRHYPRLKRDLKLLRRQAKDSPMDFPVTKFWPCWHDKSVKAGIAAGQYFYQDLHVAQRIFANNPVRHIDVGSRIDGFVAHVASFRKIEVFDIRPLEESLPNIVFEQMDLMNFDERLAECTDSISCLHALEHFGLGRYGDPICYEGHLRGFESMTKMLRPGGKFYLSVPMGGPQRIEFHAHRIFSMKHLMEMIEPGFRLDAVSYVDDSDRFHVNATLTPQAIADNFGCHDGCAIFELTKK